MARQIANCRVAAYLFTLLILCWLPADMQADDKTLTLERLQKLVNDPPKAREMRRRMKNASDRDRAQIRELMRIFAEETNKLSSSLPRNVDKYTILENALVGGSNVVYRFTLSNDLVKEKRSSEFMPELQRTVTRQFCTSPVAAWLIIGATFTYAYHREDGTYYGAIVLEPKTCNFE